MRKLLAAVLLLPVLASTARATSSPNWLEVRSPHFVVITDTNQAEARALAQQFEGMRALFESLIPHADDAEPITIFALSDRDTFRDLLPDSYRTKTSNPLVGYFLQGGDRNYIVVRTSSNMVSLTASRMDSRNFHPYRTIYHEYTHYITRRAAWMPLWLSEGLAKYYETAEITPTEFRYGMADLYEMRYLNNFTHSHVPLRTILAVTHSSSYYHDDDKMLPFYLESWALTHMLFTSDYQNHTTRMLNYLRLLSQHQDPVAAATAAFGDIDHLERDLDRYLTQNSWLAMREKSTFHVDPASFSVRSISPADANASRADVLVHNGRLADAKSLSESVLRDDPRNSLAHEVMGTLALRTNDQAAARKWFAEAVELNPESQNANFHFASSALMAGEKDNPSVEASLRKCIHLDPGFAPAYDALAQYIAVSGGNLNEAHLLTLKAVELEPARISYRVTAARVLAQQNNTDGALSILRAAQKLTASTQEADQLHALIEQYTQHETSTSSAQPAPAASNE